MRECWLKWVSRDWPISADYIRLNYSDANRSALKKQLYKYKYIHLIPSLTAFSI